MLSPCEFSVFIIMGIGGFDKFQYGERSNGMRYYIFFQDILSFLETSLAFPEYYIYNTVYQFLFGSYFQMVCVTQTLPAYRQDFTFYQIYFTGGIAYAQQEKYYGTKLN